MININPESNIEQLHSDAEGLNLEQSKELMIKDFQIAKEKLSNRRFELEISGAPEDELGKVTYQKMVAQIDLEIAKIDQNLEELGVTSAVEE